MSFDIALSGIQAINEQLNTVSNNIANAATYGFKAGRANFASVMAGTQPNGVEIGSVTQNISQNGSTQTTGRALDAAIDGRGFFVSVNNQGTTQYSRVGIFSTDAKGVLVDSNGNKVQGYGPTKNGALGAMGDVQVPTGQIPAVATTGVAYVGNLSADWNVPATTTFDSTDSSSYNMVKQSLAYDSLGAQHTISQYFVKTGTGWTPSATTVEKIRIIAETVRGRVAIKASGGIRSLETIREMVALGVSRFGINTKTAVDLVRECAALPGGRLILSDAA